MVFDLLSIQYCGHAHVIYRVYSLKMTTLIGCNNAALLSDSKNRSQSYNNSVSHGERRW